MKHFFFVVIIALIGPASFGQQYTIDSTFGINGISHLSISRELYSIGVRMNNDLVCGGYNNAPSFTYQYVLNGLKNNGNIDSSFGINGNATVKFDTMTIVYDCAVQNDGKTIAVGTHSMGNTSSGPAIIFPFILRCKPNGQLDSSFGTNGIRALYVGSEGNFAKVAILPNGKILAAGNVQQGIAFKYLLMRFNTDGTSDNTFGTNGIVATQFPHEAGLWDLDVLSDGSIIASGNEGPYDPSPNPNFDIQMCMIKYKSNGIVDSSFGINGIVYNNLDSFTDDIIHNLHVQTDGKLITTGVGNNQGVIIRYLSNGTLDSTYDNDGIKTVGHVTRISLLQKNDQLITANNYLNGSGQDIKLVRYNTDGSLDTTFGINGNLNHDISGINNYIQYATFDNAENIILCGSSDSGSIVSKYKKVVAIPNAISPLDETLRTTRLYPNPVANNATLELELNKSSIVNIYLLDLQGRQIAQVAKNKFIQQGTTALNVPMAHFSKGQYFIHIATQTDKRNISLQKQ